MRIILDIPKAGSDNTSDGAKSRMFIAAAEITIHNILILQPER